MIESTITKFIEVVRSEEARFADDRKGVPSDIKADMWFSDHAPELRASAAFVIVGIWHFVETGLKRTLAFTTSNPADASRPMIHEERKAAFEQVANLNSKKLLEAFREVGVDLTARQHFRDIDPLRLIANAWKHQSFYDPNSELIQELGLDDRVPYSISDGEAIFDAVCGRFGVAQDDFSGMLTKFMEEAIEFLDEVESRSTKRPHGFVFNPDHFVR